MQEFFLIQIQDLISMQHLLDFLTVPPLIRFFSAVFAVQECSLFLEIASPPFKKIMVHPILSHHRNEVNLMSIVMQLLDYSITFQTLNN